jgi:hypothetical protein
MLKKSFSLKEIKLTFLEANPTASVARFFSIQYTKTGKNVPNDHTMYLIAMKNIPKGAKAPPKFRF